MTNREAIFITKRLFREVNADTRLSNKAVYSLLMKHSKWLIYRDSERLKLLKKNNLYQILRCMKVIEVDKSECNLPFKSCQIFRTENKIPEVFEDGSGSIIGAITSIDGSTEIEFTTFATNNRKKNNPWISKRNKHKIFAYFDDGYLFFPDAHLKMVDVEALFLKEVEPNKYCKPCDGCEPCKCKKFLDKNFIIPDYLEAQLMDVVIKDLANTYKRTIEKSEEIDKNDKNPN